MGITVVQLCEASMLCTNNAVVYIRIRKGTRVSRRIGCCASCRPGVEGKITDEGCTFTAEAIPQGDA